MTVLIRRNWTVQMEETDLLRASLAYLPEPLILSCWKMASFTARIPCGSLKGFSLSASSSNGVSPHVDTARQAGAGGGPVILELPLDKIRRPLMRTRANDPNKVQELMDSIQLIGLQVPIDVLEVDGVYYGFSGCHRFEAHQRLGLPAIRCKIRKGTKETLRHHLR